MAIGLSFVPGGNLDRKSSETPVEPIQDAIQVLSLRLPRVVGAGAVAPGALLNAQGAAGLMGGMDLDRMIKAIIDRMLPQVGGQPLTPQPRAEGPMGGAPVLTP